MLIYPLSVFEQDINYILIFIHNIFKLIISPAYSIEDLATNVLTSFNNLTRVGDNSGFLKKIDFLKNLDFFLDF